jgi:hypothetical protein
MPLTAARLRSFTKQMLLFSWKKGAAGGLRYLAARQCIRMALVRQGRLSTMVPPEKFAAWMRARYPKARISLHSGYLDFLYCPGRDCVLTVRLYLE